MNGNNEWQQFQQTQFPNFSIYHFSHFLNFSLCIFPNTGLIKAHRILPLKYEKLLPTLLKTHAGIEHAASRQQAVVSHYLFTTTLTNTLIHTTWKHRLILCNNSYVSPWYNRKLRFNWIALKAESITIK